MANSSLAKERYPASPKNYWGTRGVQIDRIIIHHMAAVWTAKRCAESFQDPTRGASANYCIGYNGEIAVSVDEDLASGCSSNRDADIHGVTIETANDKMGEPWTVSDASLKSLIALCADIAKRRGLGRLVRGKNLCWHQMYAATSCPGTYLLSKMDYICEEANKINYPEAKGDGTLNGRNIARGTDTLILYSGKDSTGTNQWGYEVKLDKNGIALEAPHYSGNTEIPKGGYVLSGHGASGKWIFANIKKGYRVSWDDRKVTVEKGVFHTVDGVNGIRHANELCVYNKGTYANTNPYGYEVAVFGGKAQATPVYGKGHMAIPKGGFVLSGHGDAGKWIYSNVKAGTKVTFKNGYVKVG